MYPGKAFCNSGILGDDLVIADKKVADTYVGLLDALDVKIARAKSLVSRTGFVV